MKLNHLAQKPLYIMHSINAMFYYYCYYHYYCCKQWHRQTSKEGLNLSSGLPFSIFGMGRRNSLVTLQEDLFLTYTFST